MFNNYPESYIHSLNRRKKFLKVRIHLTSLNNSQNLSQKTYFGNILHKIKNTFQKHNINISFQVQNKNKITKHGT